MTTIRIHVTVSAGPYRESAGSYEEQSGGRVEAEVEIESEVLDRPQYLIPSVEEDEVRVDETEPGVFAAPKEGRVEVDLPLLREITACTSVMAERIAREVAPALRSG